MPLLAHMSYDVTGLPTQSRGSIGMCFEVGGTTVGVFVYTVYYLGLVTQSDVCEDGRTLPDPNLRAAYHWHALTLSVILLFCMSTTVIGVRE